MRHRVETFEAVLTSYRKGRRSGDSPPALFTIGECSFIPKLSPRGRKPRRQVQVYRLFRENPALSYDEIARRLKTTSQVIRKARFNLMERERNPEAIPIFRYCPACYNPRLIFTDDGCVCSRCGCTFEKTEAYFSDWNPDWSAPTNNLHENRNLGSYLSDRDYKELLRSGIVKDRFLDKRMGCDDTFTVKALSELWSLIKDLNLDYTQTDSVAKKLRRKISSRHNSRKLRLKLIQEALTECSKDIPKLNTALQRLEVWTTPIIRKEKVKNAAQK